MILISVFSEGLVFGVFMFRKFKVVLVMIVSVRLIVVIIRIGLVIFGRMWCSMMF